ncbi:peroxiredoxin [Aquiflexum lacus]|uniref:peroxiredoxin n=1 Tax=Aquiflexum lacus TaxID=2483805 RepID=UPI0018951633|nr:peroxiredoxin [Aquiflexum lacus]
MALKVGKKAPDFTLPSTSGKKFTLSQDCKGKACIIYFYPKDFTKVCTAEACDFRDQFGAFRNLDVPVIGISRDDIQTHIKFQKEYNLPFDLLSDEKGNVCNAYDALIPLIRVPKRITYFLDREHVVRAVFSDIFASKAHVDEMIKRLQLEESKKLTNS